MNKELLIGTSVVVGAIAIYGIPKIIKLIDEKHATEQLKLSFKNLRVKNVTLNEGVTFDVFFNASNPTPTALTFSQPYVQISIADNKGNMTSIANSDTAKKTVTLTGKETNSFPVSLQITPAQALKLPNLIKYLFQRYICTKEVVSKKILIEYSLKSEGINFSGKTDVNI